MTFIMGNAYQSLIISSMTSSREGIRFKSIEQLFSSDLKLKVSRIVYRTFQESGEFSSLVSRMEIGSGTITDWKKLATQNYAVILRCDMANLVMNSAQSKNAGEYFYMLSDKILPFYEEFPVSERSPFVDMLQKYHNYVFESGIRQYWMETLKTDKKAKHDREERFIKNEEYLLSMDDVYGVFYILFIGYVISVCVVLLEIFWHDCLTHVPFKKLFRLLIKKIRPKRRTMVVRRIQVPSIEVTEL
jgi:hypothetical protein